MGRPRPKHRRKCLVALAVLVLPPLVWWGTLAVLPTRWARDRVVARLAAGTARPVTLRALGVGFLGGVRLDGLTVAAPGANGDPWLTVDTVRINISFAQLLYGHLDPNDMELDGVTLRVLRRADGTLELAESSPGAVTPSDPPRPTSDAAPWPANLGFRFARAVVRLTDEVTGARLEFTGVEGQGVCEGPRITLETARGEWNGGPFDLVAHLDRSGPAPAFEAELHAARVALGDGLGVLNYLAPVLAGVPTGVEGRLALDVHFKGEGTGPDALRRTLAGRGTIALDPVRLDGSPLVASLARALDTPPGGRVGSVRSDFTVRGGRVATDNLTIDLGRLPVVLSGWTDFDGRLDYRLAADHLADRLPAQARGLLSDLRLEPQGLNLVRITGRLDRLAVTLDGAPVQERMDVLNDPNALRNLSRRIKERTLR